MKPLANDRWKIESDRYWHIEHLLITYSSILKLAIDIFLLFS